MSRYLLDTNALLWLAVTPQEIPKSALNQLFSAKTLRLSLVSAIEIAVKAGIGKLDPPPEMKPDLAEGMRRLAASWGAEILPLTLEHAARVRALPLHHRDPFDRLLIAQALEENLTIVTRDGAFARYENLKLLPV